ncbi:TPA: glycosyltransferase family 2 protein [Streptococcus suis]|nr:glycosyltransferase family 2 protein [Streptococcus suis]
MKEILISFVMPTYNSSDYLTNTMESLINSIGEYKDIIEIICVDDGSKDDTVEILERFSRNYSSIRIFRNKHAGVSEARNTALKNVRGKYVTFVDSDDEYEQNFLKNFLNLGQDFDILFTDVRGLLENKHYSNITKIEKLEVFKNTLRIGDYGIEPGVAGKFFRMQLLRDNQIFYNTELSVSEDVLLNFESLYYANNIILSPMKFYNVTGTHSLMYFNEKNLNGQVEFVNQMLKLLSNYPESDSREILEKKIIINAMTIFIDRYFGPLWKNGTYSLEEASRLLKSTIEENSFHRAFVSGELDSSIGFRYVIFRRLLKHHLYKVCLIFNRLMDRVRGFERFRE